MGYAARGEVWIPMLDWLAFVRKYMPGHEDAEWAIGPPQMIGDSVVVNWAINTECHPSEEASPPEWLKKDSV